MGVEREEVMFVCIVSDPKVYFLLIPYFKRPFKMYIGLKLLQE